MPWIVGIDEAGYGPNLGPLVMTSVACHVPEEWAAANLWKVLRPAVKRATRRRTADSLVHVSRSLNAAKRKQKTQGVPPLLIDDSKLVYSTAVGILALETSVLAVWPCAIAVSLGDYLDQFAPGIHADLAGELWYHGESRVPVEADEQVIRAAGMRFQEACNQKGISFGLIRGVIFCPNQFNELLDQWGSKGAVLGHGLAELLRAHLFDAETRRRGDAESNSVAASPCPRVPASVHFVIDKHGGRNNYAAILQNAVPEGMVIAHQEGMKRSVYSILGLDRPVRLTLQPRADSEHFCVALASMFSKYVREMLMREFNQFWLTRLPGLKPTAGYYSDATRFFEEIRPLVQSLGLAEETLWRRR